MVGLDRLDRHHLQLAVGGEPAGLGDDGVTVARGGEQHAAARDQGAVRPERGEGEGVGQHDEEGGDEQQDGTDGEQGDAHAGRPVSRTSSTHSLPDKSVWLGSQ
ncbi:hypothetical protein [Nocardioides zeae]